MIASDERMAYEYHCVQESLARRAERDKWAAIALPAIIKGSPGYTPNAVAVVAYAVADAMVERSNMGPHND